jgi:hypothetical protein
MPPKPFKPYGTPPHLDLEGFKDNFEIWHQQWKIFLSLSTINTALPQGERPEYITNILLSCLSNATLKAVLTMGLSATDLVDADVIIQKLQERCNAGRNCHVWRQQFACSQSKISSATFEILLASASSKRIAVLPARTHVCWAKSFSVFLTTMCVASFWSSALS